MTHACAHCGTGAVRVDPIFASSSVCKSGVAITYKQQVIVSKDVFEKLSLAGVKCLRALVDRKKREPIGFWSLEPEATLSRWPKDSSGFEFSKISPPCLQCQRDGYFDAPKKRLELVYDALPVGDVFATWEHFGNSRLRTPFEESLFACPRLIVSDRVRDVLCDYRGVEFIDVKTKKPNQSLQPTAPSGRG